MAYVDPPTFVPEDILTAAQLNILGDDIRALYAQTIANMFNGVAVLRTADLTVANNTNTAVSWVSAPLDTNGWWSSGTHITVPAGTVPAGFASVSIAVQGHARFAASGTGSRSIRFLLNGAVVDGSYSVLTGISGEQMTVDSQAWIPAAVDGDVITMEVKQTSGGALVADLFTGYVNRLGANA